MWRMFADRIRIVSTNTRIGEICRLLAVLFVDCWQSCLGLFVFLLSKTFKLWLSKSFDFERTWSRLFQKHVVIINLYIYGFILFDTPTHVKYIL